MATARPTLDATHREVTGKRVSHLRRDGRLPGVVYGRGQESANVSVDTHDFDVLRRRAGPNTLIDLSVDGKQARPVLINGVQVHPVSRKPLHVDLFLVRMTEELTVEVPLIARGLAPAVDMLNGTLLHVTEAVRVRALPDHLPQSIEYPVESLVDFDATIKVSDLDLPSDVTLLTDPDDVVAKVLPPRIEVEEVPEVEEGEEGAEGEAAEGAEAPEGAAAEGVAGAGDEASAEG
ncbi:MAG TPA: 50S ribosomal protein L25 [Candidatus Limnocylindrales bacterium]